jgi:hypothetical protein
VRAADTADPQVWGLGPGCWGWFPAVGFFDRVQRAPRCGACELAAVRVVRGPRPLTEFGVLSDCWIG